MLYPSIDEVIGNTPLVKINRMGKNLRSNLYAKCEFLNPGGSIKDRIAYRMIKKAEESGRIKKGDTLIEPTSGNTGIGLALVAATRGYRAIITMPEKMSQEKQIILEALGAKIIRTPTDAAWDSEESHISVAKKLQKQLPNAHILDQYGNEENPKAHYLQTAQEILEDLEYKVDMLVIGAGTGGTISGIGKRIKEECPNCIIVGVDPVGSIIGGGDEVCNYKVEGIGYDFIPQVLNRDIVDKWVKTTDQHSFMTARKLIKDEGLLCGGSSGAAMYAALIEAKNLKKNQNCVVILPDGVRNYMTKFIDDQWMRNNHFMIEENIEGTVKQFLSQSISLPPIITIDHTEKLPQALHEMQQKSISQIPVTQNGALCGLLREVDLLEHLIVEQNSDADLQVGLIMNRNVLTVDESTPLNFLKEVLIKNECVIVIDKNNTPLRIITKIDLVNLIIQQKK